MIAALLLASMLAQDVPAAADAADEPIEEITVNAVYGRTTMLFDKDVDGTLHNCRVMVSSGSRRRDAEACQATPVCFAGTASDVTDCVPLGPVAPIRLAALPPEEAGKPVVFDMPQLAIPQKPLDPGLAGPSAVYEETDETERQRVKLPPLPKPPSDGPVVTFGNGSRD